MFVDSHVKHASVITPCSKDVKMAKLNKYSSELAIHKIVIKSTSISKINYNQAKYNSKLNNTF